MFVPEVALQAGEHIASNKSTQAGQHSAFLTFVQNQESTEPVGCVATTILIYIYEYKLDWNNHLI